MYNILHNKTMRISELRKLVREVIRETVIDKDGLERVGVYLPQTEEESISEVYHLVIKTKNGETFKSKKFNTKSEADSFYYKLAKTKKYKSIDYVKESLNEKKLKEAFTKGQLFAGKMKIGGVAIDVEVELVGVDNKKNEFVTKVIHLDKKYQSKLPIGSTLPIPARIFRTPGGGWRKIKTPSVFEQDDCGCGCGGVTEGGCNIK